MNWLTDDVILVGMIFVTAFLLAQSFLMPAFGENRQSRKRLRRRLQTMSDYDTTAVTVSLVRQRYLPELSPLGRWLESLPGMETLEHLIERAGREVPAYRVVLVALALALGAGTVAVIVTGNPVFGIMAAAVGLVAPLVKLNNESRRRLAKFEEQLPDALTVMARALRAGHPFLGAMNLVAEELQPPVSTEFATTFNEINYGGDTRAAMGSLLARVPSITVMAFVSSVLIQRETGGNLAELLDRLAGVVRERFRFQRKLRTLAAEGKMAAWILSLLPFVLAGVLAVINPEFLPMLTTDPTGRKLIVAAFVLMVIGIMWLRRIVRVDV